MKLKNKTLLFVCNNKGGIGKSTSAAYLGDALEQLGYTVRYMSGDKTTNIVLRNLKPTTQHYDVKNTETMHAGMIAAIEAKEDIVIYDLPGNSSDDAAEYFKEFGFKPFRDAGLRFVVAIVANQHKDAVVGGIEWAITFLGKAEPMLLLNGSKTPQGQAIDLTKIEGGADLIEIGKNRIIEIPCFSDKQNKLYNTHPAVPSVYAYDREFAQQIQMPMFADLSWKRLLHQIMASVSQQAEWLTRMPIPKPIKIREEQDDAPETNDALARLMSKYSDSFK